MKKLLVCALAAAMSVSLLAGCGSTAETTTPATDAAVEATTEAAPEAAAPTEVTDVALKVWCPQNQVDTGIMEQQQAAFGDVYRLQSRYICTEIIGREQWEQIGDQNGKRD